MLLTSLSVLPLSKTINLQLLHSGFTGWFPIVFSTSPQATAGNSNMLWGNLARLSIWVYIFWPHTYRMKSSHVSFHHRSLVLLTTSLGHLAPSVGTAGDLICLGDKRRSFLNESRQQRHEKTEETLDVTMLKRFFCKSETARCVGIQMLFVEFMWKTPIFFPFWLVRILFFLTFYTNFTIRDCVQYGVFLVFCVFWATSGSLHASTCLD